MEAVGTHARQATGREGPSRRLLAIASDEALVRRARAGSEAAFAILYDRHHRKLLSFCRHMLGSAEEAEDAVQQAFFNALQDMLRHEKQLNFRPWLYRIARNLCINALRARRHDRELVEAEPSLVGLADQVADRGELRELLHDLSRLPVEQREALVLAELHGNSHAEVAEIIGCEREKVKSLVFQARSSLIKSREAREVPCAQIRRDLSVLRGGSLRRGIIRRHLTECEGCRRFHGEVQRQRQALALVLPVVPSATLKLGAASAAAAVGIKGAAAPGGAVIAGSAAAAGGGAAAGTGGGVAGGTLSGSLATVASKLGVPLLAVKGAAATAAVTVAAAGSMAGVKATHDIVAGSPPTHQGRSQGFERPRAVRAEGAGRLAGAHAPSGPERAGRVARQKRRSAAASEGTTRRGRGSPARPLHARSAEPRGKHGRVRPSPLLSVPPGRVDREKLSSKRQGRRRSARGQSRAPEVVGRRRSRRSPGRPARQENPPLVRAPETTTPAQGAEIPAGREGDRPLSER